MSTHHDLTEFLAPGVEPEDLPELDRLLRARPMLGAFSTLFHGSEAEVLLRVMVLGEIGRVADMPRWSPDALRARFAFIDPVKLETVLRRLRDNGLLRVADGQYQLSDTGRNAGAALGMLLELSGEEDVELGFLTAQIAGLQAVDGDTGEALQQLLGKLNDLTLHFEDAIASGSEFRILGARRRLAANARWLDRGTALLRELLADEDIAFGRASLAQRIGLAQSRLARVDASFQRALNKIESQRVTLGASGISSSDVAGWLCRLDGAALAGLCADALTPCPDLTLLAGAHELLDRAEPVAASEPVADGADSALPAPDDAPLSRTLPAEDLRLLELFAGRLNRLDAPASLADVVPGGGFAQASYRLSLLALLRDADAEALTGIEAGDGPVADFLRLALDVRFTEALQPVSDDDVAAISVGSITPRAAPSRPTTD
ncbi:MAG: hypothetical protein KKD25_18470 [Gammaproteobacteria bacterium]|jgi:hypothetical protein|nr:hypothetical protein [Gammaproteobacteria bacterium]MBU0772362.1 hypothetical protein [Gammaproteobacteria bacterium]MBU0854777.1 hypothetical protein [Gammaproteobacteria bacterium]MBU1845383.1 hypothetical protein [Gammaproteobacteria bacterium]